MRNKDWEQVETIFETALSLPSEDRDSYISQECSDNNTIFSEVQTLISAFEENSDFLEEPVISLGMNVLQSESKESTEDLEGQKIGFYKIKRKLGEGGMGEVYLAEDTRLKRKVALKFLTNSFGNDKWAKRQFIREAQAVAMIEHPNICSIYGIEEIDGHHFIVMQYIDGSTLSEFINNEELTIKDIQSITHQLVSAIAIAHSYSIIHRDIKPGNIMITSEGQVKVLDFGLAKVIRQTQKSRGKIENTRNTSQNGLILGTVSYMSPEQLRAEKLDYRSDIFSVGIVLYKLFTKQNPFDRNSQAETIAAILSSEPKPLSEINPNLPNGFNFIVQKCLQKDKDERFQSAAELLVETEKLEDKQTLKAASQRVGGIFYYAITAILFLLLVGSLVFIYVNPFNKQIQTLAVIPISNQTGQKDKDYLSNGLTESLIDKFSLISNLKVKSINFVSKYKGKEVSPQTVGQELNADVILVSKIIQKENNLVLQSSLINTTNGETSWNDAFILDENNLVSIQDELYTKIADTLEASPTLDEEKHISNYVTTDEEAQRLYFLGRYYLSLRGKKDLKKAIEYFTEATKRDPYYAKAWTGLADTYSYFSVVGFEDSLPPQEAVKLAKAAAKKALEINDQMAETYTSMAMIKVRYDWDWKSAEEDFKKSISLKPEYAPAYYGYSNLLVLRGRLNEALTIANKAQELDPFTSSSDINIWRIHYFQEDDEKINLLSEKLLEKYPNDIKVKYVIGFHDIKLGKFDKALEFFEKLYETDKLLAAAPLGYTYGKTGQEVKALDLLADLNEISKDKYVPPQEKAIIFAGIGDNDKAFKYFMEACNERFPSLPFIVIDPLLEELHTDRRFAELTKCANL